MSSRKVLLYTLGIIYLTLYSCSTETTSDADDLFIQNQKIKDFVNNIQVDSTGHLNIDFEDQETNQNWRLHITFKDKESQKQVLVVDAEGQQKKGRLEIFDDKIKLIKDIDKQSIMEVQLENLDNWYIDEHTPLGAQIHPIVYYIDLNGQVKLYNFDLNDKKTYTRFNNKKYKRIENDQLRIEVEKRLKNLSDLL